MVFPSPSKKELYNLLLAVIGIGPWQALESPFTVDERHFGPNTMLQGNAMGTSFGCCQDQIGQGKQTWIQIDPPLPLHAIPILQGIGLDFATIELGWIDEFGKAEVETVRFATHLRIIIIGVYERCRLSLIQYGAEQLFQFIAQASIQQTVGNEHAHHQPL